MSTLGSHFHVDDETVNRLISQPPSTIPVYIYHVRQLILSGGYANEVCFVAIFCKPSFLEKKTTKFPNTSAGFYVDRGEFSLSG